jgi:hypothetical protein
MSQKRFHHPLLEPFMLGAYFEAVLPFDLEETKRRLQKIESFSDQPTAYKFAFLKDQTTQEATFNLSAFNYFYRFVGKAWKRIDRQWAFAKGHVWSAEQNEVTYIQFKVYSNSLMVYLSLFCCIAALIWPIQGIKNTNPGSALLLGLPIIMIFGFGAIGEMYSRDELFQRVKKLLLEDEVQLPDSH